MMIPALRFNHIPARLGGPLAVVAAALLVGGCGGGGGPVAKPTTTTGSPPAAGVVLNLTGTEYSFDPTSVKASAGRTTIRFTDKGATEHDLSIDALHVHIAAAPGKTAETTLTLTPGTYTFYCTVPGHRQSGMQGTLTVS
jgi:plastocyanin